MKYNIEKVTLTFFKRTEILPPANATAPSMQDALSIVQRIMNGVPIPMISVEEHDDCFTAVTGWEYIHAISLFIQSELHQNGEPVQFSVEEKASFMETEVAICSFKKGLTPEERLLVSNSLGNQVTVSCSATVQDTLSQDAEEDNKASSDEADPQSKSENAIDAVLINSMKKANSFFENTNIQPVTEDIILSLLMVSENGAVSDLSSKKIEEYRTTQQLSSEEAERLDDTLQYLGEVYTEKTPYLKKAHLPMIFVCAQKAKGNGIEPDQFRAVVDQFFENCPAEYKKASDNGTASKSNVSTRIRVMLNAFSF